MDVGPQSGESNPPVSMVGTGGSQAPLPSCIGPPSHPGSSGTVENYDLLRLLGEGGMGLVFLARDRRSGAKVAVKVLKPAVDGNARAAAFFRKETQHLAKLAHPHIVRVLDAAPDEQGGWFVMPYLERGSLDRLIREQGPLPADQAAEIARQVGEALAFAHSRGIIHRDLKPRNVLLTDDGQAVLTDFGLARSLLNDELLDVAQPRAEGTVHYMSPQTAAGELEDTRGDVYALGALIYEMLTGQAPYADVTDKAHAQGKTIAQAIAVGPPSPISKLNPKAAKGLVAVAEGAMARELKDRYARVGDVIGDLERLRRGEEPAGPHGESAIRSIVRRCTSQLRRPLAIGAASLVLIAIGVVIANRPKPPPVPPQLGPDRTFNHPAARLWTGAVLIRWLANPRPSLVVAESDGWLEFDAYGRLLRQWKPTHSATVRPAVLADDQAGLLFTSWSTEGQVGITAYRHNLAQKSFLTESGLSNTNDINLDQPSFLRAIRFLPTGFTSSDSPKLLAFLYTNYGLRPRGLCCFDYASGALEWTRLTGPPLINLEILDLNGDGTNEVLCSSNSPDNGNAEPDAGDDSHCYVFAFDSQGEVLWKQPLGGPYGHAYLRLVDLEKDGRTEIVSGLSLIETFHATNAPVLGRLVTLNPSDGAEVLRYEPRTCLISWLPVEDVIAPGLSILGSDCEGNIHVLDPQLRPKEVRPVVPGFVKRPGTLDRRSLILRGTARLGIDRKPYVVATTSDDLNDELHLGRSGDRASNNVRRDEAILILDRELRVVHRYAVAEHSARDFAWTILITDFEADGEDEILLLSDRVEVLKLKEGIGDGR